MLLCVPKEEDCMGYKSMDGNKGGPLTIWWERDLASTV